MQINWKRSTVIEREECTTIPEGISVTITDVSIYVRVRTGTSIALVKVDKKTQQILYADLAKDIFDDKDWRG